MQPFRERKKHCNDKNFSSMNETTLQITLPRLRSCSHFHSVEKNDEIRVLWRIMVRINRYARKID